MKNFDVKQLLDTATQRTGLSDFGPEDFREGLEALVEGINAQQSIRDDRWNDTFEYLVRVLNNRLWFARDLKDHPEILDQELLPPVVILPMPRTGSTKLQRLLGASDSFQSLLYWRMHMFARIPGLENGGKAERIRETEKFEKWIYEVCPDFIKGHPVFALEPEEEQILNEFTFRTHRLPALFYAPKYADWYGDADKEPTYSYMLQQLKYLQWQFYRNDPKPWLLKSPTNFGYEEQLIKNFGRKTKLICPHRDPVNCIISITRTSEYSRDLFTNVDNKALANEFATYILDMFAASAKRNIEWRANNPDVEVLDLSYREINDDAIGVLHKVYDFLDIELTPQIENSVKGWEEGKSKKLFARNTYAPEEFGLTEQQIHGAFSEYMERFAEYI